MAREIPHSCSHTALKQMIRNQNKCYRRLQGYEISDIPITYESYHISISVFSISRVSQDQFLLKFLKPALLLKKTKFSN